MVNKHTDKAKNDGSYRDTYSELITFPYGRGGIV